MPAFAELPAAPGAVPELPPLRLKRGEDRRLRAGHLWIFSNEVDNEATPLLGLPVGAVVRVLSDREQFLGYAYVNPHALICARILSRSPVHPPDLSLLEHRLRVALALRERLYTAPYYRWVFGESDALPGLVLDRYGEIIVGQIATAGMEALRGQIEAAVTAVLSPHALIWKNDGAARELEQLPRQVLTPIGRAPEELRVLEGSLDFSLPLVSAQKTGWFYDQSGNREQWRRWVTPGMRVLDVCSYAGAWAISALSRGAGQAVCVDASEAALAVASRNAAANGVTVGTECGDAFEVLDELVRRGERFDAIVLDPPAFIKRKKDIPRGQAAYRKLNQVAMRLLERDALLVSCSCSYHLAPEELLGLIQGAARHAGRFVQVLYGGGQSPDHPVHPAIQETRYLKAFFCRVTRE
ncbi:MAG TPA: class I SAM-dependent rRNA methyltransferase [Steroidobacteraceae bacterium]|jgi:23S rRNA (cytosine1962-C5)-methyltransferase|nr:class I SAM-dependent rRNA methyltransferase [Steroidobacteraceae bacterium]